MVIILCGESGSGKDALLKKMVDDWCIPIISTTSRPIRDGETDGVEYNFVTRKQFENLIKEDRLIEYRTYNTLVGGKPDVWYYGALKEELDDSRVYVVILDIEGTKSFITHFGKNRCFVSYIHVDDAVRERRARLRGSFDKTEWDRRLADDRKVFSKDAVRSVADIVVSNNGTLNECYCKIKDSFAEHCFKNAACFSPKSS